MSQIKFNGPEAIVDQFPHASKHHKETSPGYPPSLGKSNLERTVKLPPTPPLFDANVDDAASLHEMKEEMKNSVDLLNLADAAQQAIITKLDEILDRRYSSISRKLYQVETRVARIEKLLREGCPAGDQYWDFNNPGDLKAYGILHYVANKSMAMIYQAIDENAGTLRDDGTRRRKRVNHNQTGYQ